MISQADYLPHFVFHFSRSTSRAFIVGMDSCLYSSPYVSLLVFEIPPFCTLLQPRSRSRPRPPRLHSIDSPFVLVRFQPMFCIHDDSAVIASNADWMRSLDLQRDQTRRSLHPIVGHPRMRIDTFFLVRPFSLGFVPTALHHTHLNPPETSFSQTPHPQTG